MESVIPYICKVILIIESSADFPSVAICDATGKLCFEEVVHVPQSHSEKLPVLVQNALNFIENSNAELKAVAVNSGPGSYTGLRIGVSLAKGICYAKHVPLIAVDGLQAMGQFVLEKHPLIEVVFAMIDARRDEVFMKKIYRNQGSTDIEATILVEHLYDENWSHVAFVGNSNEKALRLLNVQVGAEDLGPLASQMIAMASTKFQDESFENVAYFEPFYLKDFVPGVSKKFAV